MMPPSPRPSPRKPPRRIGKGAIDDLADVRRCCSDVFLSGLRNVAMDRYLGPCAVVLPVPEGDRDAADSGSSRVLSVQAPVTSRAGFPL